MTDEARFHVLIAGAGVAGLETALALRELAADRLSMTLLTAEPDFVYRPMRVQEPFAQPGARTYPLDQIAADVGAELVPEAFGWLDAPHRAVHTESGAVLRYDALVLAMGARPRPAFDHVVTMDDRSLDDQLHGLIQDVEGGYVHSIAFVAPAEMPWPLPMYELALLTARRAYEVQADVSITIVTPEHVPLAIFGSSVSQTIARLLEANHITVITSASCSVPAPGKVAVRATNQVLDVDRVVAMPSLSGPSTPGIPGGAHGGFIAIDQHCRVRGLENVFAAGDATDFTVKHGAIAAQQADAAAEAIAALAGAPVQPRPFQPEIQAILLGADRPLYMRARLSGEGATSSQLSEEPLWSPPTKIAARYLAPYLDSRDREPVRR